MYIVYKIIWKFIYQFALPFYFSLLSLYLFITHKSVISLVLLHLWLPSSWIASVFRPFYAKCGVPYSSCYAMPSLWWSTGIIAFPCMVCHGSVKPVESDYENSILYHDQTQEYQAIPFTSHFGRSRDTYFFLLRS